MIGPSNDSSLQRVKAPDLAGQMLRPASSNEQRECIGCGVTFSPKWTIQRYCTDGCRRRWHSRGNQPRMNAVNRGKVCSVSDCTSPARTGGLCNKHYKRLRNHGDVNFVTERVIPLTKICRSCGEEKPRTEFLLRGDGSASTRSRCKPCHKTYDLWRIRTKKHGVTQDVYREMLASQGEVCAICADDHEHYVVDHCHVTEVVRGLLCKRCNMLLGAALDSPKILQASIDYLERSMM